LGLSNWKDSIQEKEEFQQTLEAFLNDSTESITLKYPQLRE